MKPAVSVYKLLNSSGGSDLLKYILLRTTDIFSIEPLFSVLEDIMQKSVAKVVLGETS